MSYNNDKNTDRLATNNSLTQNAENRDAQIVKASIIGIVGNMILVAFKILVGLISSSIAIILDGVNNATDAISSIVTIIGTKLASKAPDKEHPFGHGRIEYLTSAVIAAIILAAGLISLRESVEKIIHPGTPEYSEFTIIVIIAAIFVKIILGLVFSHYSKLTNSEALRASGIDSNYDAVLSGGTLVVAIVQNVFDINIDGVVGAIISLVVCKAGIDVLRDSLEPIIGTPEDRGVVDNIKAYICSFDGVCSVHDVVLVNFGPSKLVGSLRIDVPDNMLAVQVAELSRDISRSVKAKYGAELTIGISVDNTSNDYASMEDTLKELASETSGVVEIHAFYVDENLQKCYFDIVADIDANGEEVAEGLCAKMKTRYPKFSFDAKVDADYCE